MPPIDPALREAAERSSGTFLTELAALVAIESGSHDHLGVEQAAAHLGALLTRRGFEVRRPRVPAGVVPPVVATVRGRGRARVLLCGHLDTVFERGTLDQRPFTAVDSVATGPGVCDDKGGLLAGVFALDVLRAIGFDGFEQLTLLATTDEEIGSVGARDVIHELAATHDVALCLECAREDGSLVSGRAGVADVVLEVRGRAAHAGIEPELGSNAAVASARLAVAVSALNGRWDDVKLNVGVLASGDRPNVVPDRGRVVVDVRATSPSTFDAAIDAIRRLAEQDPGDVSVSLEAPAPPWRPDDRDHELGRRAVRVAAELGLDVGVVHTGGSADANLLSASGIAVLDGLGPVGGRDHSPEEWLDVASVPDRIALLAALVADLCSAEDDRDLGRVRHPSATEP